jgi:type 1 glutamine amidotransferase
MTQLGQQSGLFEIHCTQDCAADFTAENLKNYDIVMFYTTGVLPISDAARDYFTNEWLKQPGHGVIGFHSATDTYRTTEPGHRWYQELIGGTKEFQIQDEIYQYVNWVPENVHVLMSLNMAKCKPQMDYHVPIDWAREWGDGKIYYTNLGHNEATWTDKRFVDSVTHAVRWVLDLEEGDAKPNPDVSAAQEAKAKADAAAK